MDEQNTTDSDISILDEDPYRDSSKPNRNSASNEVYVNEEGELIIPQYLQSQIQDDTRPPITNWSREMDFKLLHYLKNMPARDLATKKWKWLADKLSEYGVTYEDVRVHVSIIIRFLQMFFS